MVPELRQAFNQQFTKEKYEAFLQELNSKHPGAIEFRVAETAVFADKNFKQKLGGCLREHRGCDTGSEVQRDYRQFYACR